MRNYAPTNQGDPDYLPRNLYLSAKYYALSLRDAKRGIEELGGPTINYSDMPHGTTPGDPTFEKAAKLRNLTQKIENIEEAAEYAAGEDASWLLKGTTIPGMTYPMLEALGIPMSRATYQRRKRRFYNALSKRI